MKIIYYLVFLFTFTQFIFNTLAINADISEKDKNNFTNISSFDELKPILVDLIDKRNPTKTLITLPLEKIVIRPTSEGFKKQDENYKSLAKKAFLKIKNTQRIYLNEVGLVEYENQLTDSSLPDLIKSIQELNVPIIITTSNLSGSYNDIPYLEIWTLNFLKKHNIDLSKGAFSQESIVLQRMTEVKGTYPTFYKGLLSCNSDKGDNACHQVLSTLLASIKFLPDTVVIINSDDNILNIMTKQLRLLRNDIEVIGFKYEVPPSEFSVLNPNEYFKFISEFAEKVNNVTRLTVKNSLVVNPYEE